MNIAPEVLAYQKLLMDDYRHVMTLQNSLLLCFRVLFYALFVFVMNDRNTPHGYRIWMIGMPYLMHIM